MVSARGLIICPDLKTWLQERPSEFSRFFFTFRDWSLGLGLALHRMYRRFHIISHFPDLKTRFNNSNVSHFLDCFAVSRLFHIFQKIPQFR